jgi:pSer/pThr/pTyr-binding forkhead associated (FHA) protein
MLGELIPRGGGDTIPLIRPRLLIGRRASCDICLQFPNISSHHCELELMNGYWYVRDLGSRNGIKVNGHRCSMKWLLPGDELTIARHKFEVAYTPEGDPPPPDEEDEFAVGLMEKAGLVRRKVERPDPEDRRDERRAQPQPGGTAGGGASASEDEQALRWLSED